VNPVHTQRGVTLVELIAFIVIASVVAVALLQVFHGTTRGSHSGEELTQAVHLAEQRMEVIRGQRVRLGYAGFTAATYDPCPPVGAWAAAACNTTTYPAGSYTVTTTAPVDGACGAGCKLVTVTVTDPYGEVSARLAEEFWDY
jgi:Tfp pilus assembly protein PilW